MLATYQTHVLTQPTGARLTANRTRVLAFLFTQSKPLTHQEINQAFSPTQRINHVTLYRVLEWLRGEGLIHSVAGDDQISRFRAGHNNSLHPHAHFQCSNCATFSCMEEINLAQHIVLPKDYQLTRSELLLKGLCPACN